MAGSGQPKVQSVVLTLEALLHVGLGIALCRIFGVIGAPFTGLVSGRMWREARPQFLPPALGIGEPQQER